MSEITYKLRSTGQQIAPDKTRSASLELDTVLNFLTGAGWVWVEPQVVNDPAGHPHYITAESGFDDQLCQVYQLHTDLIAYGMI